MWRLLKIFLDFGEKFPLFWGVVGNCGEKYQMKEGNVQRTVYIFNRFKGKN